MQTMDYSGVKYLTELPAGKTEFTQLTGLTVGFPGSVAWDGSYLAATDQNYQYNYVTAIHRFTVSGSAVTIVRTTVLTDDAPRITTGWLPFSRSSAARPAKRTQSSPEI